MSNKSVKEIIEGAVPKITQKRGEDQQDYLSRLAEAVSEVDDATWNSLGNEAQAWVNEAIEAINNNKTIADFPAPAAATSARSQRKAATEEAAPSVPDVIGAEAIVTTQRDKVVRGTILEIDEHSVVLKDADGEEHEFDRTRVKSFEFVEQAGSSSEGGDAEPQVGDTVTAITKRGKEVKGEVVEITDGILVINDGNGEVEVDMSTAQSITVEGAEEVAASAEPAVGDEVVVITKRGKEVKGKVTEVDGDTLVIGDVEVDMSTAQSVTVVSAKKSTGRATATAQTTARGPSRTAPAGKDEEGGKATKITAAANGGISVTDRMFEIVCETPDITSDGVAKKLKAEKLTFNEKTLLINFKLANKIIKFLKDHKHFK